MLEEGAYKENCRGKEFENRNKLRKSKPDQEKKQADEQNRETGPTNLTEEVNKISDQPLVIGTNIDKGKEKIHVEGPSKELGVEIRGDKEMNSCHIEGNRDTEDVIDLILEDLNERGVTLNTPMAGEPVLEGTNHFAVFRNQEMDDIHEAFQSQENAILKQTRSLPEEWSSSSEEEDELSLKQLVSKVKGRPKGRKNMKKDSQGTSTRRNTRFNSDSLLSS